MIIRCPQCEHTRSISENNIPPIAELATCPKCKHRFRFRTLRVPVETQNNNSEAPESPPRRRPVSERPPGQEVIRPQSAFREAADRDDIWDAVDELHNRWQTQLEQHVTEVDSPGAAAPRRDMHPPARPPETLQPSSAASEPDALKEDAPPLFQYQDTHASPAAVADAPPPSGRAEGGLFRSLLQRITAKKHAPPKESRSSDGLSPPVAPFEDDDSPPAYAAPAREAARLVAATGSLPQAQADLPTTAAPADSRPEPDEPAPEGVSPAPCLAAPQFEPAMEKPEPAQPFIFPYTEDGPKPEERVELDMRMLRETPESRPTRDLGALKEFADQEDADGDAPPLPEEERADDMVDPLNDIPWEHPSTHGWLKGFMATIRGVMFQGPAFFSRFHSHGSLAPGYLFFLALGYTTIVGSLLWSKAAVLLLPDAAALLGSRVALPLLLLIAPIALGLMLLFVTGFIRLSLRLLAPDKSDFVLVYKVVCYSVAPFVLSIVPFVGPPIGALWFVASLITGCRFALRLPWQLAVLTPLPPATLLLGGLVWYFL